MDSAMPPGRLLKANEVATLLDVDRRRVYELPIRRIQLSEKCFRWDPADIEHFVNSRKVQ